MDTKEIMRDLLFIEGVLSDIETIELPWPDFEQASIGVDWDAAIGSMRRIQIQPLSDEFSKILVGLKKRIQDQKDKILALDYTYPEI